MHRVQSVDEGEIPVTAGADARIPAWGRTLARFALIVWPIVAIGVVPGWTGSRASGDEHTLCSAAPAFLVQFLISVAGAFVLFLLAEATGRWRRRLGLLVAAMFVAWLTVAAVIPWDLGRYCAG